MRPLVFTTMLLLLLISFSQAQDIQKKGKDVNVSTLGLKGKIKSIVRTTYLAVEKFGEAQKGDRILITEFHKFDEKGNVIELRKEDPPGEITGKWTYEFDENGILMKDGGIGWYGIYKYDISGNCSEYNTYESDGTLRAKTKYKYDKNNNRVESNHYNSDGSLNYRITNVFDGKKNITETSNYNAAGNIDNKFFYKYDTAGNRIEVSKFKKDGSAVIIQTRKYDKQGNQIEFYSEGEGYKSYIKYDNNGHIIEYKTYTLGGTLSEMKTYTYQLDGHLNWIQKVEINKANKVFTITERQIEYF